MLHLLRVEWLKIKNYRTFWILLAMTILSIPGINYIIYDLSNNSFGKVNGKMILGSPFAFPDAWQTIIWNSGLLFILPAILIITLTTNEFTFKTHRQNIIDGWSRMQFITVKLFELLLLSLVSALVVFLTVLVFGCIANKVPSGQSIWQDSRYILYYFIQMISYSMIAFLLSMFIRRAGLAIAAFLIYKIAEKILVGVLRNRYDVKGVDYLPEEVTNMLTPQPYGHKILQSATKVTKWEHLLPIYMVIAALYLVLYCVITARRFTTSDL